MSKISVAPAETDKTPVDFMSFLENLTDFPIINNDNVSDVQESEETNPVVAVDSETDVHESDLPNGKPMKLTYPDAVKIYNEGIAVLKKTCFLTEGDAIMALKTVVTRAFHTLSAVRKRINKKSGTQVFWCSYRNAYKGKASQAGKSETSESGVSDTMPEISPEPSNPIVADAINIQHTPTENSPGNGDPFDFPKSFTREHIFCGNECNWSATLESSGPACFYFSFITDLDEHCPKCFTGNAHLSSDLTSMAKKYYTEGKFTKFNILLGRKLGFIIPKKGIQNKAHYNDAKTEKKANIERAKAFGASSFKEAVLVEEDKMIIGELELIKERDPGFVYTHSTSVLSGNDGKASITFLAFMWPSQIRAIQKFGDVMFIDSTFNVNNRKYNALNLVVIDEHCRSILAATAFVKNELEGSYVKFLEFIRENVPHPKRLPTCLIADRAPQIHAAVSRVFPYCRHIHCAFHILKENALRGCLKGLDAEEGERIRNLIYIGFVSHSFSAVENSILQLFSIYTELPDERLALKKKLLDIISHIINASRPMQDIFTCDSIASSRVESVHSKMKDFDLDHKTSLLRAIREVEKIVLNQKLMSTYTSKDGKTWAFLADKGFMSILDGEIRPNITEEVLERMYREYLLCVGRYNVSTKPDGSYSVIFNSKKKEYDEHVVFRDSDGTLRCKCMIRKGYPCRHIFAVAKRLNIQVTRSTINSRFYLRQSGINMEEEHRKAIETVTQSIQWKKERYGTLFHMKPHADVSSNIENGEDIIAAFEKDLSQPKEADIQPSIEDLQKEFSHPQSSSSPGVAEEEEIEIASLRTAVESPSDSAHDPGIKTITAPSITPPEKEKQMNEPVGCRNPKEMLEEEFEAFSKYTRDGKRSILISMFYRLLDEMTPEMMDEYFRMFFANYMECRDAIAAAKLQVLKIEGDTNKNPQIKAESVGNPEISPIKKEISEDKKPFLIKEESRKSHSSLNTASNSIIVDLVGGNGPIGNENDDGCVCINADDYFPESDCKFGFQNKAEKGTTASCDEPNKKKRRKTK